MTGHPRPVPRPPGPRRSGVSWRLRPVFLAAPGGGKGLGRKTGALSMIAAHFTAGGFAFWLCFLLARAVFSHLGL